VSGGDFEIAGGPPCCPDAGPARNARRTTRRTTGTAAILKGNSFLEAEPPTPTPPK
jgi:hypothetical protein